MKTIFKTGFAVTLLFFGFVFGMFIKNSVAERLHIESKPNPLPSYRYECQHIQLGWEMKNNKQEFLSGSTGMNNMSAAGWKLISIVEAPKPLQGAAPNGQKDYILVWEHPNE